jgi:integrase
MPRPRKDGTPASPALRRNLTELTLRKIAPKVAAYNIWDLKEKGLVLRVQPSGSWAFKAVYHHHGRPRWYHLGRMGLADARRMAAKVRLSALEGKDPVAERRAERGSGSFAELAARYVEEFAKRNNKSWRQADALVKRHLLPKWARLDAKTITRADVRALMAKIAAPVVANQTLAAASAIFSWGIKQEVVALNPCLGVERNKTVSRDRTLSDAELPLFWNAFADAGATRAAALKVLLLTGQRPGEVAHMRREHISDGWWTMPGEPVPTLSWPGTKNAASHRLWLPQAARAIIGSATTGFVFEKPALSLPAAMKKVCQNIGAERTTPHDLRRTHGSTITGLGFGREAMNRVQNHREGGIADVYDRHEYAEENKRVMEAVASHILALAEGRKETARVIPAVTLTK